MTSTSFIIGTGFMKCMPSTRSRWGRGPARVQIEMLEVFVARMAPSAWALARPAKILCLISRFSVAASMARKASEWPAPRWRC